MSAAMTIADVQVLDADGGLRPGPVHLSAGRIVGVGPDAESPAGAVRQLEGRGGTVVPGLIDAHFHAYGAHLDMFRGESRPLSWVAIAGARRLGRALRRGFTTVRDVAGGDAGLAAAIADGLLDSPRYLWTGPALSQTGGHGDPRPGDLDCCVGHHHGSEVVDGVDALRVAVRDRFRRGAHAIKIMTSGGVISLTDPIRIPQYSPEEVRAVTEEAARRGSYVAAHAYSPEAIVHSVTNGVRSIEHGNLLDAPNAALMAEHGAFLVPTLATYDAMGRRGEEIGLNPIARGKNAEVLDAGRHAIELAVDAGVSVGFGTDLMGDLEEEQLQGVRAQVEVLGLIDALRSMTVTNAALIGRDDLGRVEQGAVADLLLLPGDPTQDAALLWSGPRTVIQGGAVVLDGCVAGDSAPR